MGRGLALGQLTRERIDPIGYADFTFGLTQRLPRFPGGIGEGIPMGYGRFIGLEGSKLLMTLGCDPVIPIRPRGDASAIAGRLRWRLCTRSGDISRSVQVVCQSSSLLPALVRR